MAKVFLDSAFAIALSAHTDQFHSRALRLAEQLEASKTQMITTRAVLLEIGNALSKVRYRLAAVSLLEAIETDSCIEIIPLSEELYTSAFSLFRTRPDKEWGLVDCISFIVMQERGITDALTTDEHFRQMGFRPLLRESTP
ncbi:Putative nucleic acid-binding protein, contains PIN domain [Gloeomargarita lithophora Alchichica-D10]|uniref:Nucleic acid-binding protein, contains PIN domain n=1 Tax=Gloeomargarita lithophora Alchichica-D10 TaxID=1188229 RepID=A0A1J0A9J8_9CYAN|nr:type II toxin-antitoxin system VapC family toxin [Gloeomargarita lithophora]APB32606.1 Putative nucleic acid-binding protein, contains PIN domain [Gloeomargarita lithophora Alchichica-D10]